MISKEQVEEFYKCAMGEYNNDSNDVKEVEAVLVSWLSQDKPSLKEKRYEIYNDMLLIFHQFKNDFHYDGIIYRGINTTSVCKASGIASFTYSFEIALRFAGFVSDFESFLEDKNKKLKDNYFVSAIHQGENFDFSGLLFAIYDKTDNGVLLDSIDEYSGESEVIAMVDCLEYTPYTRKDILEYTKNNILEYAYWYIDDEFFVA